MQNCTVFEKFITHITEVIRVLRHGILMNMDLQTTTNGADSTNSEYTDELSNLAIYVDLLKLLIVLQELI